MITETTQVGNFSIGDKVQYMHTSNRGGSISFSTREGKIIEFAAPHRTSALVQAKNGRKTVVRLTNLRNMSQPSPVNDVFKALVEGAKS